MPEEAEMMNVNGIVSKISAKADVLAAAVSIWERYKDGGLVTHFTEHMDEEIRYFMDAPLQRLKYKLLDSDHLYTQLFKAGVLVYALGEVGLINSKYKTLGKKVAKGAGFAALVCGGSGPGSDTTRRNFEKAPLAYGY